ncbi:MAG TPA: NAD(P)/FAD-dependent oxidoreductase [Candidatus Limnocylindrales bacterium]|nr:NAD(P)/FAD-dependent oxidoreductase [Candidatus Limnocylindrales bacterium]
MNGPVDVAIIGAGPSGTVLGATLARAGVDVLIVEAAPAWRWRAGGVFTSPAAVAALRRAALSGSVLDSVARPIPAMRLETRRGTAVRLTYGADGGGSPAVGFDRSRLDPALEASARAAGVTIRRGVRVDGVDLDPAGPATLRLGDERLGARVVIGADGTASVVARAAGVHRPARLPPRIGLSWHVLDPRERASDDAAASPDARLVVIEDGYVGLAPVPDGRLNIGIVLGRSWHDELARLGAGVTSRRALALIPPAVDDPVAWADAAPCDRIAGAAPLGGRVTRRAGPGWFLVGDAAGFLDPFTGEGLHRALVSIELAAPAILASLRGPDTSGQAASAYDRAMRDRFASKDVVSWLVQSFLGRPRAFEYAARRLAGRPEVRATMGLVMGDLVPASRALDPRFIAALLAP